MKNGQNSWKFWQASSRAQELALHLMLSTLEIWERSISRTNWWSSQTTPTSSSHHLWKKQERRRFSTSASGQRGITSLWTIPRPSKLSSQDQEVNVQSHHPPWSLESYVQSRWRCWESPYPAHSLYLNTSRRQFPPVLVHCLLSELFERMDWIRTASITCSSLLSSPDYCTHLLLGGASRMTLTVNDLRESWGEAFDRVSTRKTHHHSPSSVKSLTMICSRRFAPIIHMFCTVSCRRNLHVYTLCENDTIILFCLTIPSHSWIAISSIEFYIKTPML